MWNATYRPTIESSSYCSVLISFQFYSFSFLTLVSFFKCDPKLSWFCTVICTLRFLRKWFPFVSVLVLLCFVFCAGRCVSLWNKLLECQVSIESIFFKFWSRTRTHSTFCAYKSLVLRFIWAWGVTQAELNGMRYSI